MKDVLQLTAVVLLSLIALFLLFAWLMTRIRYRISPSHFQILFCGVPIRRFRLEKIDGVSKRRRHGWAEKWHNTSRPSHRTLIIRRSSGLIRNIEITPRNRYVFKNDLEQAIARRHNPDAAPGERVIIVSD